MDVLFHDALHRPVDAVTRSMTGMLMGSLFSPRLLADMIFSGAEFRHNFIESAYQLLLHRDADPSDLQVATLGLENGMPEDALLAALAGSAEYQ